MMKAILNELEEKVFIEDEVILGEPEEEMQNISLQESFHYKRIQKNTRENLTDSMRKNWDWHFRWRWECLQVRQQKSFIIL